MKITIKSHEKHHENHHENHHERFRPLLASTKKVTESPRFADFRPEELKVLHGYKPSQVRSGHGWRGWRGLDFAVGKLWGFSMV